MVWMSGLDLKKQTWSILLFNENIHFSWLKQEIFIISRQLSFYFWKTQFWLLEISDNSVQFLKNSVLKRQKLSFSEILMAWMSWLVSKKGLFLCSMISQKFGCFSGRLRLKLDSPNPEGRSAGFVSMTGWGFDPRVPSSTDSTPVHKPNSHNNMKSSESNQEIKRTDRCDRDATRQRSHSLPPSIRHR